MNMTTLATILGILGGGGIIGLVTKLIRMSMEYQKLKSSNETLSQTVQKQQIDLDAITIEFSQLKTKMTQNDKRDEEERKENANKFEQLFNSRNKTNEALVELTTTVKMMVSNIDQQFVSLNHKIDELKKDIK